MMDVEFDIRKPLQELDPDTWNPQALDEELGPLVKRLAHKPVRRLTAGELRELITRGLSLSCSIPLAIGKLEQEPFLEAQRYPGDLLTAVLEADTRFWAEREDLYWAMVPVLEQAVAAINTRMEAEEREDYLPWHLGDDFMAALIHFRGIHRTDGAQ